jgi:hypothetical protein
LILSDPVVDKEILDLFIKRHREKYTWSFYMKEELKNLIFQ